ncbi:peptidoglycan bridge formation glycyltransferase FemA/FemB family protein [Mollicutes bacterium LVI A0078]|nr:peptidoglycan bridge formation glycyltransferase FemA/FemB family protein [Mollicutes bacterium LVI A0075]WOO91507.1 peptidoglycan bridge formation glycyltransferase FemA/FemB family protein [Mollicutes bacterium LVI A0078]
MKLKFITETEYDNYLEGKQNISIQMRSGMKKMLEKTGWTCHYLGLVDNDEVVGAAILSGKPMKFAGMFYTCQYGPHLDYTNSSVVEAFFGQLPQLLKGIGTSKFEFNPNLVWKQYTPSGEQTNKFEYPNLKVLEELGYVHQDINLNTNGMWNMRFHYMKNLGSLTKDDLLKSYGSQAKRSVKKAIQNGIEIEELAYDNTKKMHELMEMSASKHGFAARDIGYYERANEHLGVNAKYIIAKLDVEKYLSSKKAEIEDTKSKIDRFVGTKKEKQIPDLERKLNTLEADVEVIETSNDVVNGEIIMSAGVFLINGPELIYLFGGNNGDYQKFCSSFALQHYVMQMGIDLGIEEYNMYGIDGTFDGTDSVLRFKSSFDGYVNEFVGTYELILNAGKLKRANTIKKLLRR